MIVKKTILNKSRNSLDLRNLKNCLQIILETLPCNTFGKTLTQK